MSEDGSTDLAAAWSAGDDNVFCDVAIDKCCPRITRTLRRLSGAISIEDAEDCIQSALAKMLALPRELRVGVGNPAGYLAICATNEARDVLRERERRDALLGEVAAARTANPWYEVSAPWAELVMEEVVSLEVESSWVPLVVREAVARLTPAEEAVIRVLCQEPLDLDSNDFEYGSSAAAAELDISEGAFRTRKHRALKKLAELIPAVLTEMGLRPSSRDVPAIFGEASGEIPSGEDEG